MNKPANTLPWETMPCPNPRGWTTVGYILRGDHHGTFVPVHHWEDHSVAQQHVFLLNRGIDRATALEASRRSNDQPAPSDGHVETL